MLSTLTSLPLAVLDAGNVPPIFWIGFLALVALFLALDLGVFHRKSHEVKFKEAMIWSAIWIFCALSFNLLVWYWFGPQSAKEYLTGYLVEKALAVDNIFVFAMLFGFFAVPAKYQHKVLFWGILGALGMRAIFIFAGVALIERFHWTIYVFGAFLILTGLKMVFAKGKESDLNKNPALKLLRRMMPVSDNYEGEKLVTKVNGKRMATPLLVVLVLVEFTDLIFAVDSIPAILAITTDPFIVFTSNVFAILGLRSMYFALAGVINLFHLLHYALAGVLIFIGGKMLLLDTAFKIPTGMSLAVVAGLIAMGVLLSILIKSKPGTQHGTHADGTPAVDH
ncbi:TerC family protein [bacterium]|nr:TerC family protein [bacterium]